MDKNKSFWDRLFSVKYLGKHVLFNVFGIKLKFKIPRAVDYMGEYDNLPITNNRILFKSFHGSYTCNPKYIAEEILRQNLPYELYWIVDKNILKYIHDFPRNIKLVMENTPEDYRIHKTAKIWISHKREIQYIRQSLFKRPEQVYIQTWHGSLGIKKTGEAANDKNKKFTEVCKKDARQFDYMISNGTYTTNFFKETFWNNGKILEVGHPRNDIFFNDNSLIKKKVYSELNIDENKKIVLYAPTFREDYNLNCYDIDIKKLLCALNEKFSSEYVFMLRLHPKLIDLKFDFLKKYTKGELVDATDYGDMQELLAVSDVVITDYSSCIYDFMLTRRPGFIFATDIQEYENGRGLYYPLTDTPFPIAQNTDELVKNIENFDEEKYKKEVREFLDGKGCIDDGHASERVVELIKNIIDNSEEKAKEKQEALV